MQQRIYKRTIKIAGGGVNDKARRLVDHDQIGVFEHHRQRNFLRLCIERDRGGQPDMEYLATHGLSRGIAGRFAAFIGNQTGRHQGLEPLSRQARRCIRKRTIEPPAIGLARNAHLNDLCPPVHVIVDMEAPVRISSIALGDLIAAAGQSPDAEICGLLFGSGDRIEQVRPCANVAIDPREAFEIDPGALIAAHRSSRAGGPAMIGHYHSHPSGTPAPSPRDAAAAANDGALWLILAGGRAQLWRAVPGGALHDRFNPVPLIACLPCTSGQASP